MTLSAETVRRIALRTMGVSESFVADSTLYAELNEAMTAEGSVVGLYLNDPRSYVVITNKGLHVQRNANGRFIAFEFISEITAPLVEERDLDVMTEIPGREDVESVAIPILGITEDMPDIMLLHEFLIAIMQLQRINPIGLKNIVTKQDLIDYLRTECEWELYTGALANYLETDFNFAMFDGLSIDESMLAKPDFWRAMAVILNVPVRTPVEKIRGLRL
jgi:hypothetical protein